ncbi:hypothetical protein [Acidomonas methanolica]|uniref:hypothetical protein n=1 Tax=Acidomonas methanolica TaxID=437 RepID=UPI00211A4473
MTILTALPCLGARPAVLRPRQPRLDHLPMMTRAAPAVLRRDEIDPAPIMADNDRIGDCTAAGLANAVRAVSALNGFQTPVTTQEVVAFYSASTGYRAADPASDRGGVETDVLAHAALHGYALEAQTLYPLWGTIEPGHFNSLRLAASALGVVYLGVELAIADQAGLGGIWDTETPDSLGDRTPGSWGGHCLLLWAYDGTGDEDTVTLLTWGTTQRATWRWLRSRMTEAHGLLWPQLASPAPSFLSVTDIALIRSANTTFLNGALI